MLGPRAVYNRYGLMMYDFVVATRQFKDMQVKQLFIVFMDCQYAAPSLQPGGLMTCRSPQAVY